MDPTTLAMVSQREAGSTPVPSQTSFVAPRGMTKQRRRTRELVPGPIEAFPPTGKSFSRRGASILELHEGKVKGEALYWDSASLLRRLELMPEARQGTFPVASRTPLTNPPR